MKAELLQASPELVILGTQPRDFTFFCEQRLSGALQLLIAAFVSATMILQHGPLPILYLLLLLLRSSTQFTFSSALEGHLALGQLGL